MANLRIVTDNAADRATIVTSSTAGSLAASNMKTDIKTEVWRSTSKTASITLTWGGPETVGVVALPFTNFTSTATMRVRVYTNVSDSSALHDTGAVLCSAYSPLSLWDWGVAPLGVNAYTYGGGTYAVVWFPQRVGRKVVIDIVDTNNTNSYVESARIVTGSYWSPQINASFGAQIKMDDRSQHERNAAGDLLTNRASRHKVLSFDMSSMTTADRAKMWDILRGNGMTRPMFISLSPENTEDPALEQANQVYGKLAGIASIAYQMVAQFATKIDIEEI